MPATSSTASDDGTGGTIGEDDGGGGGAATTGDDDGGGRGAATTGDDEGEGGGGAATTGDDAASRATFGALGGTPPVSGSPRASAATTLNATCGVGMPPGEESRGAGGATSAGFGGGAAATTEEEGGGGAAKSGDDRGRGGATRETAVRVRSLSRGFGTGGGVAGNLGALGEGGRGGEGAAASGVVSRRRVPLRSRTSVAGGVLSAPARCERRWAPAASPSDSTARPTRVGAASRACAIMRTAMAISFMPA